MYKSHVHFIEGTSFQRGLILVPFSPVEAPRGALTNMASEVSVPGVGLYIYIP